CSHGIPEPHSPRPVQRHPECFYRSTHVSTYLHWRAESLLPLPQFQCKACAIPCGSVRILGFSERILRNPQLTDPTKLLAARLMRQDEAIRLPPIWHVFAAAQHRHGKHNRPCPGCRAKPWWACRGSCAVICRWTWTTTSQS